MAFHIGFSAEHTAHTAAGSTVPAPKAPSVPKKSVVQVSFPGRNMPLAYYNDRFDLKCGDLVYVDGKLEGVRGRVIEVNCNFKIRIADYKRVIAVADTDVHGSFFMAGSHFVTFDPDTLPAEQVRTWYLPPAGGDEEFVSGNDDVSFPLSDLKSMDVSETVAERGHEYYLDNKVRYLSVNGTHGYAIVEGSKPYEAEFALSDGQIRHLTCSCFCPFRCKHEFAVMLQLREELETIEKNYAGKYARSGYFAAIAKGTLCTFAVDGKQTGSFTL